MKVQKTHLSLLVLLIAMAGLSQALAGPLPVGSIVGSQNATLDGQQALPDTTVVSGDSLQVNNGVAMVSLGRGSRMVLGRNTGASFRQEAGSVTVSLDRGRISLYQPAAGNVFRVKAGNVTVAPAHGYKALGEVAMAEGFLLVSARNGTLRVEKDGITKEVSAGKTITIPTTASRSQTPDPAENRHLKRLGGGAVLIAGAVAIAGATTAAVVLSSRTPKAASAVAP